MSDLARAIPAPKQRNRRSNWYGVGIPKNTPAEIIDKLNKEINAGLADLRMKARRLSARRPTSES
jgi:tripartite-type tricarboxylate transporter receptor subunit TctC